MTPVATAVQVTTTDGRAELQPTPDSVTVIKDEKIRIESETPRRTVISPRVTALEGEKIRIGTEGTDTASMEKSGRRSQIVAGIRNQNAADRKVYEAFDQEVSLDFKDTPLGEVFEFLRTKHQLNIWADMKALEDEGVNLETRVDIRLNNVPLSTGLSLMLKNVGDVKLDFYVDRGVLCITTAEKSREIKSSRTYNLTGQFKNIFPTVETYANKIKAAGPDTLEVLPQEDSLVIETSYATHKLIEDYIVELAQSTLPPKDPTLNTKPATTGLAESVAGTVDEVPGNVASLLGVSGSEHRAPILSGIRNLTAADRKVYEAFDQTTRLEFPDNTLSEVFDFVAELHRIKIRIDRRSLEDEGVALETRLKCVLNDVSLRTALPLILDSAEGAKLDYYVDGGILFITTEDAVANKGCLRFYDLSSELVNLSEVIAKYA